MSFSFENKIVAITGGSTGIGRALIEEMISRGAKIATCGRSQDKLYSLQVKYSDKLIHTVVADVSRENDCKRFIDSTINTFGGIDILINNAGISMKALVTETDLETIRKVMDVNFWGTVYCTKFALQSIIERKGSIVGISSVAGYRGLPGRSGYSASKHAVNGWLEALRTELADTGVNVMWIAPGFTTSNIRNAALDQNAEPKAESSLDESSLMSAEECARHVVRAIAKRKRTLVLTFTGKRAVILNKLFPGWVDKLTRKYFYKDGKLK
jgi:short-subunit dehydrogenase